MGRWQLLLAKYPKAHFLHLEHLQVSLSAFLFCFVFRVRESVYCNWRVITKEKNLQQPNES